MGCTSSKSADTIDSVSKNKQPSPAPTNGAAAAASPASPAKDKDANGTANTKNGDLHHHSAEPEPNATVAENNHEKSHVVASNHNDKCGADEARELNTTSAKNGDIVKIDDIHVETSDNAVRVGQSAENEIKAGVQSDIDSRIVTEELTSHATAKTSDDTAVTHVDQHKPHEGESAAVAFHAEAVDTHKHDEPEKFDQHVDKANAEAERHEQVAEQAEPTEQVVVEAVKQADVSEQNVPEVHSHPQHERAAPLEAAPENATADDDHHHSHHHHHAESAQVTAEAENQAIEVPETESQPLVDIVAPKTNVEAANADDQIDTAEVESHNHELQEVVPEVHAHPQDIEAKQASHDHHHHHDNSASTEQVTEQVVSQEESSLEAAHSEVEHATPLEAEPDVAAHDESTEQVAAGLEHHHDEHEEHEEKAAEQESQPQEHVTSHETEEQHSTAVDHAADEEQGANAAVTSSTEDVTFPAVPKSADNEVSREDTQALSAEVEVASNDSQSAANCSAEADQVAAAETSHSDHVSHHDDSAVSQSQDDHNDESNTTGDLNEQGNASEQLADQAEN